MSHASADDIAHLDKLIAHLRRRQRVLEEQYAIYGIATVPSYLVVEKEDGERQLAAIETRLTHARARPINADNPYLGLLTFQEQDADRFFGRDALIDDLVERARRSTFLAVLGASGSGKSSLVRAGLLPLLKAGALSPSERWRYAVFRPGARPLDALAAEIGKLQDSDLDQVLRMRASLAEHANALLLAADLLLDRAAGQRLVLVVDQFEELWTLASSQERAQFINVLLTVANAPDTPMLLVLAMRADFLHRAAEHPDLAQAIADHDVIVSPMTEDELGAAIVRPAENVGATFESGLVDDLIKQTHGRVGALPLLEYTLLELWKQRQFDGVMTWEAYRAVGGIEGALAARADAILAQYYTSEQQEDLRKLLLRLVQPGEGVADTRRRVRLADLVPTGGSVDSIQSLLKPLSDERLLTTGRDEITQEEIVEISHEALIRAWPTFGRWIADARADLHFQLQLEEAAKEWQVSDKNIDLLWSGLRLAQAEAWIERAQPRLNARDQSFLDASRARAAARVAAEDAARRERESLLEARAAAERRNAARLRVFLGVVGVFLLIAIGLVAYVVNQGEQLADALKQSQQDRDAARRAEQQESQARAAAQQQARISGAQANAGEALFELTTGNTDRALLLAQASILTDTQSFPPLIVRAIRQSIQQTVPSRVLHSAGLAGVALAWSPDGRRLLTGNDDGRGMVWDVASDHAIVELTSPSLDNTIYAVAWSPDGKQVLTGSRDGTARVWDAATGQLLVTLTGHRGFVYGVAWSPDGKQVLTGSADNTARVWGTASGRLIRTLEGHAEAVSAVAWSPDGKQVLTGSEDNTARVWDAADGHLVVALLDHAADVLAVAWSPDGKEVLTGSADNTARVWDAASGQPVRMLTGHTAAVLVATWSRDGQRVLTGSDDRTVRVWDVASGQPVRMLTGHTAAVLEATWSPDGQRVLVRTNSFTRPVWVWDVASGQPVRTLEGHTSYITAVAWSPDGKHILTGSSDSIAQVWDVASGQLIRTLEGHTNFILAVAWSPDGKQMLTGSLDKTARVWDAASGRLVLTLIGHTSAVRTVAWSPDGQHILTGSADNTARMWDAASGRLVRTLEGHVAAISAVAWSPDGKQVLTGSLDKTARVWDAATGQLVHILKGHTSIVNAAGWSPDGTQVLTGSDDKTARVWDVTTGLPVRTLEGHTSVVTAVAWAPDGTQVLTGSADETARIWIADDQLIIAELTRRVCNIYTDEDIRQTIPSWRGCTAELAAVAADLKEYDALRPRQ